MASFADYQKKLKKARVIIDSKERKRLIQEEAQKLAASKNLKLREDDALLEEVCGLIEWPNILIGSIDKEFMDVPAEALVSAMRSHQKYFSLETRLGALLLFLSLYLTCLPIPGATRQPWPEMKKC